MAVARPPFVKTAASSTRVNLADLATWGIAAFVFTIPFDEIVGIPGIGSPARLVGLFAAALGVIALVGRGRLRVRYPLLFVAVAAVFVLWNVVSIFWSFDRAASLGESATYVQLLVLAWLVSEYGRDRTQRAAVMQAFVLGNYVAFAVAAFNVLVGGNEFRDTGPFNANQFAITMALAVPMAALLMGERRPSWLQVLNVAYPFVTTFGVVLAASRSGLIVFLITLAVIPLSMVRFNLPTRIIVAAIAVATVWFGFGFAPRLYPDFYASVARLGETTQELSSGTLTGRTEIWQATLGVFLESPIVGIGSGAAPYALAGTDLQRAAAVHNAYLSVAANTGIIGLGLFLFMLGLAFTAACLAAPKHRLFMIVLAIALFVAMMPGNSEARKYNWFVLSLLSVQRPIVLSVRSHSSWLP